MKNFDFGHCGTWKDGQLPVITPVFVVSFDQTNRAYQVSRRDYDDFISWVALNWAKNDVAQHDDESDADFLERIGVHVREVEWR